MSTDRLPSAAYPASVTLKIRDGGVMRDFYRGILGFADSTSREGTVVYSLPGTPASRIEMIPDPNRPTLSPSSPGLFHLAILYPDAAALGRTLHRIISSGHPLEGTADHSVSEAVYLRDPEGNGLELYIDRPRQEWSVNKGEIQMTTEYLDIAPILRAGEEVRVEIPQGRIGHIHLQVSDLERSGLFYQNVIGLDVTLRSFPGALFLSAGGYHHHLGLNVWRSRGKAEAPDHSAGLQGLAFTVPSAAAVHEARGRAERSGVRLSTQSEESVTIMDPDGLAVRIESDGK